MITSYRLIVLICCLGVISTGRSWAQNTSDATRPYRLEHVDLKQRVIWGAQCLLPAGRGLSFGGQDQQATDGRPHTRLLIDGQWKSIHDALRQNNPLQARYKHVWRLRTETKNLLAGGRRIYFQGRPADEQAASIKRDIEPGRLKLIEQLTELRASLQAPLKKGDASLDAYQRGQVQFALEHLNQGAKLITPPKGAIAADWLKQIHRAQIALELAAEAFDAEPPPRALHCGAARRKGQPGPVAQGIVYDPKTGLYVMFGGDHLDYLTNDTWVFDPAKRRWMQRHPGDPPPPRANHRLVADGNGNVKLIGGYTYASNTDYVGGQYLDHNDVTWVYDIEANTWSGLNFVAPDSRVYRSGPFHPNYYLQGEKPDAAKFEAWLKKIPVNTWVATNPKLKPRLNRDWGTARIDPGRDIMLRWSGGHSAHGGTDVPHFHFATNRWELPFPVEFPLGQLYSNTSYPNGFNFNLRPWMTGHTYQNYAYDPPSGLMVKAGRPNHYYLYDPDVGDWIERGPKPKAMTYNSCFYTLTLTATPGGALCWDKNGRVHLFDHAAGKWNELALSGDKLPGAVVDNSTIAYDAKRNRVLMIRKPYGKTPFEGQIYALDLKTAKVSALSPRGKATAQKFAYIDRCCYDPVNDLLIVASYLNNAGAHTPTPAYDCANNRWVTLNLNYELGKRGNRTVRKFPHGRSDGMMFDVKRKLIWGTDTNSQIYVLRIEVKSADLKLLQ